MIMPDMQLTDMVLMGSIAGIGMIGVFVMMAVVLVCVPSFRSKSYKAYMEKLKKKRR